MLLRDEVQNRFELIRNVPAGVVLMMGVTNTIETFLVETLDTSLLDQSKRYKNGAGGIGMNLIHEAVSGALRSPKKRYVVDSLKQYIDVCVSYELGREGTTMSIATLNASGELLQELEKAVNPVLQVKHYPSSFARETLMSCTDAWALLKVELNNNNLFEDYMKFVCSKAGLDPNLATNYVRCREILGNHIGMLFNPATSVSAHHLVRQAYLSEELRLSISYLGDEAALMTANQAILNQTFSMAAVSNEWIPVIRGVILAITIGMIPLLVIFFPTGLFPKAVSALLGFYVFLAIWGILDALVHTFSVSMSQVFFNEVRVFNMGVRSIKFTPSAVVKSSQIK